MQLTLTKDILLT
jgi:hypothetical protein